MKASIALLGLAATSMLLFPSCTDYNVSLTYKPPVEGARINRGSPAIEMGRISDTRDVRGTELGAVRNEIGIPIKVIHAKKPVAEITHNAFAYALEIRGMLAKRNPRYIVSAEVLELWCHQFTTQDAGCRIRVNITRRGENRPRFSKVYAAKRSRPTPNVSYWSRVEEMATVTSEALQAVVDGAIDDPALRRALR
jgi:hypothetical protein